jgi:opacity protein-like surface antigen
VKRLIALPSILILISCTCFNVAQAEVGDTYIGIQYGSADTSFGDDSSEVDLDFLTLQLGVWVNDNVSIEVRMGTGNGDESVESVDFEIESIGGLYGTYHWNLGNHASIYGIAGWSTATLKLSGVGDSDQETENGLSVGAGLKFSIFSVEYMRYLDTSDVEADAVSVGLNYTFK